MAKQVGIIKLTGKLGDNSYYHTKNNGYLVRKITSVDAERIRKDPAFARVRENNTDFGRCAFGVKLVRAAFIPMFEGVADSHMTSRLMQALMGVIKSDMTSAPGLRRLELGNIELLRGFEFNNATSLEHALTASYTTEINQQESTCTMTVAPSTGKFVRRRAGATHFRFLIGIAKIDFKTGAHTVELIRSAEISVRKDADASLVFTSQIAREVSGQLFVTLGVEYLQRVNGEFCVLMGREYTALTLIHAEKARYQAFWKMTTRRFVPKNVPNPRAGLSSKRKFLISPVIPYHQKLIPMLDISITFSGPRRRFLEIRGPNAILPIHHQISIVIGAKKILGDDNSIVNLAMFYLIIHCPEEWLLARSEKQDSILILIAAGIHKKSFFRPLKFQQMI